MRTHARPIIATAFLLMFFFASVLLFAWQLAGGSGSDFQTPFTSMMQQSSCVPASTINGTYMSFNTTNCQTLDLTTVSGLATSNLGGALLVMLGSALVVGVSIGLVFPNVWAIFAGATVVLVWFLSFPLGIINSQQIPFIIKFCIYGIYFLAGLAVLAWYRGGELP